MKKELEIEKPNVQRLKDPKKMKQDPKDVEMKDVEKTEEVEEWKDADLLTLEGLFIQYCLFTTKQEFPIY